MSAWRSGRDRVINTIQQNDVAQAAPNGTSSRLGSDDALSDFLSRLCFSAWQFRTTVLGEPMRVAGRSGQVCYYLVLSGQAKVQLRGEQKSHVISQGDQLIVLHDEGHELRPNNEVTHPTDLLGGTEVWQAQPCPTPVRILTATFDIQPSVLVQHTQWLPQIVHVAAEKIAQLSIMSPLLAQVSEELQRPQPGTSIIVNRCMQLMFLQTLRNYVIDQNETAEVTVAFNGNHSFASLDPRLGSLMRLIHSEPQRDWSVTSMAREAKLSKSTFSERFRRVVGQPPIDYLTEVRMCRASELLQNTGLSIKRIARLVGYESESAFSNAFKRRVGEPPITHRRHGGPIAN